QVFVHRRQRRKAEPPADLLEARSVTVLRDELVQVIQDLALSFRQRKHQHLQECVATIRKRKAKVKRIDQVAPLLGGETAGASIPSRCGFPSPSRAQRVGRSTSSAWDKTASITWPLPPHIRSRTRSTDWSGSCVFPAARWRQPLSSAPGSDGGLD